MHPQVFEAFEGVLRQRVGDGFTGSVLEIGAVPTKDSLLMSPMLAGAGSRIGINLAGPHDFGGFTILEGNANDLSRFDDGTFDMVLSNATLEHDPFFWLSVSEMRRVTRTGGAMVIGVPGYTPDPPALHRWRRMVLRRVGIASRRFDWLASSTLTYRVHNAPGDYYRFSPQAVESVFFAGMTDVHVVPVMQPPRLIGSAVKRA
jgi:SAM-dependent methyltransferase